MSLNHLSGALGPAGAAGLAPYFSAMTCLGPASMQATNFNNNGISGVSTIDGQPISSLGSSSVFIWQPATTNPYPFFSTWTGLAQAITTAQGACTVYCDNSLGDCVVSGAVNCYGKTQWIGLPLVTSGASQSVVSFAAGGAITDAYSFQFLSLVQTATTGAGGVGLVDNQAVQFVGCSLASAVDSIPLLAVTGADESNIVLCSNCTFPNTQYGTNGTLYVGAGATAQLVLENQSSVALGSIQWAEGATAFDIQYDPTSSIPAVAYPSPANAQAIGLSSAVYYNDANVSPQLSVADVQDAIDALKSGYLPLTGGTVTGTISLEGISAGVDSPAALHLGTSTADAVFIGQTSITTTNNGSLTVSMNFAVGGDVSLGASRTTIAMYGANGIAGPVTAATADATTFAVGTGSAVDSESTWTASGGSNAYTIGQVVQALVGFGLLAA